MIRKQLKSARWYSESSPCAEHVFPEQSAALALISEDVSSPECVQQAEVLAAEANRTLAQARSAVASAILSRSGFFLPTLPPVARAKARASRKISKDPSCLICGRSDHFPERRWKGSGKGKIDLARFTWTVVLQGDVVLDCGATETAGGVEAVQILVDAVTQGFS